MPRAIPHLLAFDTSTESAIVAMAAGDVVHARVGAGGSAASKGLLPLISAALADAGLAYADLDAIAFCAGPGSFTGVRTAAAVSQGLALALDRPVIAVGALDVLAHDAARLRPDAWVAAVVDARMGEVYYALYRRDDVRDGEQLTEVLGASVAAPGDALATLLAHAGHAPLLAGDVRLFATVGGWPGDALDLRIEPASLARRALAHHAAGRMTPAEGAQPAYVRNKVALTTGEREKRRAVEAAR